MDKRDKVTRALRIREAGKVMRCHVIPHVGEYSVGFHTWGMLTLLDLLHPRPTLNLFRAILYHDLAERHTGDMPGIVRVIDPELYATYAVASQFIDEELGYTVELSDSEKEWLHALDKLELWMWCHDQSNIGNDHTSNVIDALEMYFTKNNDKLPTPIRRFLKKFEWSRTPENIGRDA